MKLNNTPWTEEEDKLLKEYFPISKDEDLQEMFNRSITSIKGRAYRLGLKKHWNFVQMQHKQNAKKRWMNKKAQKK